MYILARLGRELVTEYRCGEIESLVGGPWSAEDALGLRVAKAGQRSASRERSGLMLNGHAAGVRDFRYGFRARYIGAGALDAQNKGIKGIYGEGRPWSGGCGANPLGI